MFKRFNRILAALPLLFVAATGGTALAAADLAVSMTAPSAPTVYASASYSVVVNNIGNQNANNVSLTIALPTTGSAPTNTVLGTLGPWSTGCSKSGTNLVCSLGTINKNKSKSVSFTMALPYSSAPIVFTANATTTNSENSYTNNSASRTVGLSFYANTVDTSGGFATVENDHCTGTNLTSWFICTLFPSSISGHTALYFPDGTITFPGEDPLYTGTWSMPNSTTLNFTYAYDGVVVATFTGRGVTNGCFEGITTFVPNNGYNSGYLVCP